MLGMMSNTSKMLPAIVSTLQRGLILFKQPMLEEVSRRAAPKASVSIIVEFGTYSLTTRAYARQTSWLISLHLIHPKLI